MVTKSFQKHLLAFSETSCSSIEGINVNGKGVPWCHGEHSGLNPVIQVQISVGLFNLGFLCGSAMWETWVRSLGWEDPLEKGKATHSSILAWRILYSILYSPWGCKESDTTERLSLSL